MIVGFPTALYDTVLPRRPADAGNVTWLISSQSPPRTELLCPQLPDGVRDRLRPTRLFSRRQRRDVLGQLAISTTASGAAVAASGAAQYEIGQVLEFGGQPALNLDPILVPPVTELRYDTNLINLTNLGLSPADAQDATQQAGQALLALQDELNFIREFRGNIDIDLADTQKQINDTERAIAALATTAATVPAPGLAAKVAYLRDRLAGFVSQKELLIRRANELSAQATRINNDIQKLSPIIN